tara:strand:+ start:179 stop:658 length:480 start_codon:yes stop_codon:yes gene_type:complete
MNQQRVKQIIAAYGGNAARWPEAERVAALKLCQSAPELAVLQREQAGLDQLLDSQHVTTQCSATEVLAQLVIATEPVQMPALTFWNRTALWLLPDTQTALWRPALAAALPLAIGIGLGVLTPDVGGDWSDPEQEVFMPYLADVNNAGYSVMEDWNSDDE